MTLPFDVTFSIVLRSPFIMAGMDASGVGIDTPALRDECKNAILPGDHLKGLLRESLNRLELAHSPLFNPVGGERLKISSLFGSEATLNHLAILSPNKGRLRLRDLVATDLEANALEITRIEIDDQTGTVKTGALQVIELVAPLNATVTFVGTSRFYGTQPEATALEKLLRAALRMIPAFGGARTSGFGEHDTAKSSVTIKPSTGTGQSKWPAGKKRCTMTGHFDSAFMVNVRRDAENVYVGGTVIPGATIKGTLAEMLKRAGRDPTDMSRPLGKALAALHVSHAQPVVGDAEADLPLPFSIMRGGAGKPRFECALGSQTPGLIDGLCADFQPDWKLPYFCVAGSRADRPASEIAQLMRGHTAINSQTGIAEDQKLYLEVLRASRDKQADKIAFRFTVDTTAAEAISPQDTDLFRSILGNELDGLGKTHATLVIDTVQPAATAPPVSDAGPWRILLETPALLLDPDGDNGVNTVEEALRAYFAHVLPGVTLKEFYVRRNLAGDFAVKRSRRAGAYRPISLFSAGSCFLIAAQASVASTVAAKLDHLMQAGLPVLRRASGQIREVTDWQDSVYLPANGYGRISVEGKAFTAFDSKTVQP